jgi:hypothetical protein
MYYVLITVIIPFFIMLGIIFYNEVIKKSEILAAKDIYEAERVISKVFFKETFWYLFVFYLCSAITCYVTVTVHFSESSGFITTNTGNRYIVKRLDTNANIYTDRSYHIIPASIPIKLKNYTIISTGNEDKVSMTNDLFSFKLCARDTVSIYIVYDSRTGSEVAPWIKHEGFKLDPSIKIVSTDAEFGCNVYYKKIYAPRDTVLAFGGNVRDRNLAPSQIYSMYYVLLSADVNDITNANILDIRKISLTDTLNMRVYELPQPTNLEKKHGPVWNRDTLKKKIIEHYNWLGRKPSGKRLDLNLYQKDPDVIASTLFNKIDFSHTSFLKDSIVASKFTTCILADVELFKTRLAHVDMFNCILDSVDLSQAKISDCRFSGADMRHANFTHTVFNPTVDFSLAKMNGAIFEPDTLPGIPGMAAALGLDSMTYLHSSSALIKLRDELKKSGFDEAQRKISAAIKRRENELNPSSVLRFLNRCLFEYTCDYGINGAKPLLLVMLFTYIFFNIYLFLFLTGRLRFGIYYDETQEKDSTVASVSRSMPVEIHRILFLTMVSTFSIGFAEFNFSDWVKRLSRNEYRIETSGTTRVLTGIQSLISLFLFALAILIYFGDPFNQ